MLHADGQIAVSKQDDLARARAWELAELLIQRETVIQILWAEEPLEGVVDLVDRH